MRKITAIVSGLFLAVSVFVSVPVVSAADAPASGTAKVIAYYFHGSFRCPTCKKLESYAKAAINDNFKNEIASGKLEFKEINVEEKENDHFIGEYQLYTKTLILSLEKDGKETKWKNLDRIWDLVGNKKEYMEYVKNGVDDFLKEAE
ncbi:MAG TPA: nitrophenyl compound nitroreductase subunit ArsF family protein [Candidatus Omnitrophota bacterium]|nr:nitrophenyl compound nitroreductase subunit ArsF family protein [Candidatus Omnitrophota bacterium]HPS20085.1 nitrophenyl compound nitroreductase subunit ArsF family protein [Candidatus Omnitrophota bacterium]